MPPVAVMRVVTEMMVWALDLRSGVQRIIAPIADCGGKGGCINSMMCGVFWVFNRRSTVPIYTRLSQMVGQNAQHGFVCGVREDVDLALD
jgi:hypothetical protein